MNGDNSQNIPSWTAFNAATIENNSPTTTIGYAPIINSSPIKLPTVFTIRDYVHKASKQLGQTCSVLTLDEAIYCKAKEIQWRCPDKFEHMIIRLGGFHIIKTFLACIGKLYEESGLSDIIVNSGLYGSGVAAKIMTGKSYNRSIRAHTLIKEAMDRMVMTDFKLQYKTEDPALTKLVTECSEAFKMNDHGQCKTCVDEIVLKVVPLAAMLDNHKKVIADRSDTCVFWLMYIDMVDILMRFIRAEREGLWNLHLDTFDEMLPFFHALGRTNYARWGTIYITDMRKLQTLEPQVYQEFLNGNHVVKRSKQSFNQVSTDLALEQSLNRDCKVHGGLIGKTQNPGALSKWLLTAHLRSSVSSMMMSMCDLPDSIVTMHKECGTKRRNHDENDVKAVMQTLTETFSNPFANEQHDFPENTLINISTGTMAQEEVASSVKQLKEIGRKSVDTFIEDRITSDKVSVFSPLARINTVTFATQRANRNKEKKTPSGHLIQERQLLGRILMVSQTRNIDTCMREMLSFELSTIPLSLAHPDGSMRKTNKSLFLT